MQGTCLEVTRRTGQAGMTSTSDAEVMTEEAGDMTGADGAMTDGEASSSERDNGEDMA